MARVLQTVRRTLGPAVPCVRLRRGSVGYDERMSQTRAEQGSTSPGGPDSDPASLPEPEIHPSSTPEGPSTIPAPPTPQPEPGPESAEPGSGTHARTQAEQLNEEMQEENAETSLDQPSDASGNE